MVRNGPDRSRSVQIGPDRSRSVQIGPDRSETAGKVPYTFFYKKLLKIEIYIKKYGEFEKKMFKK